MQRLTTNNTPALGRSQLKWYRIAPVLPNPCRPRPWQHPRMWPLLFLAGPWGCGLVPQAPRAGRPHLVEKGHYQALYDGAGRLDRVAYDADGDGRADVLTVFGPNGAPLRAEIDSDKDGVVDRWESYGPDGRLAKVATSRRTPGVPDLWSYPDGFGGVSRREYDDDGDGRPERAESLLDGVVVAEEFDTTGSGRWDKRVVRGPDGAVARIDSDPDDQGHWRRSITVSRAPGATVP